MNNNFSLNLTFEEASYLLLAIDDAISQIEHDNKVSPVTVFRSDYLGHLQSIRSSIMGGSE